MEARVLVIGGLVAVLVVGAIGLVALPLLQESEPTVEQLLPKAEVIVVTQPDRDIDLKPGRDFTVLAQDTLRGDVKTGTSLRVFAPNANSIAPLSKGRKYVLLLQRSDRGGYDLLSRHALQLSDKSIREVRDGSTHAQWDLAAFQKLLDTHVVTQARLKRDKVTGRWALIITQGTVDNVAAIVDFDESGKDARIVSANLSASLVRTAKVDGQKVDLKLTSTDVDLGFSGKFENGIVRGELDAGDTGILPARLEPTESESLADWPPTAQAEGTPELIQAREEKDSKGAVERWIATYPDSPVNPSAWVFLLGKQIEFKVDQPTMTKFIADYVGAMTKWGPLLASQAQLNCGLLLARSQMHPDLALQQLDAVLQVKGRPHWHVTARRAKAFVFMKTGKEAEGLALYEDLLKEEPYDVESIVAVAKYHEEKKDVDQALDAYVKLAVVPGLEQMSEDYLFPPGTSYAQDKTPSAIVQKLWKEKHSDTKGLAAYVAKRYDELVPPIRPAAVPPRKPARGNRVSLIELFTGTTCPPCVAPDVACEMLSHTYAPTELVVLEWHLDIPGLNPFTTEEGTKRFEEKQGKGTPLMMLNGQGVSNVGGPILGAVPLYQRLRKMVDKALTEKTAVSINLKAHTQAGKLHVHAKVDSEEPLTADTHLLLAIAEKEIILPAPNGIRRHHNVVRGGLAIGQLDGELKFDNEIDLKALREQTIRRLAKIDAERQVTLPKPADFKSLLVVAYVVDESGNVLQTTAVPVEGLK